MPYSDRGKDPATGKVLSPGKMYTAQPIVLCVADGQKSTTAWKLTRETVHRILCNKYSDSEEDLEYYNSGKRWTVRAEYDLPLYCENAYILANYDPTKSVIVVANGANVPPELEQFNLLAVDTASGTIHCSEQADTIARELMRMWA